MWRCGIAARSCELIQTTDAKSAAGFIDHDQYCDDFTNRPWGRIFQYRYVLRIRRMHNLPTNFLGLVRAMEHPTGWLLGDF